MASANHASTSQDSDLDIEAKLKEINVTYEADVEIFEDDETIEPDRMELKRQRNLRVKSRASISQSDSSFSSDKPEPATSSRSNERTGPMNLEETDYASWEKQADMSHFSTSSQNDYSSDSSEGSERSFSSVPSISRVRLISSSSSEDFSVPNEHPVDPMESLHEHIGLLDSFECSESEELLDSLESSDSDFTDDDTLLASNEEQSSEDSDVDAIAEHDHQFNLRIINPEENLFNFPGHMILYRSAIANSLMGFTYKWGRYAKETSEVCLLQFCSVEGLVIFHIIRRDRTFIPTFLEEILSNENILKVGIFPGPILATKFDLKNALDLRYALQICGMTPKPIEDIVESIVGYSINMYGGTSPTDKYFLETTDQYRTAFLEVFYGIRIFIDLRIDYHANFQNNFERLCEIHKGKIFRIGRLM